MAKVDEIISKQDTASQQPALFIGTAGSPNSYSLPNRKTAKGFDKFSCLWYLLSGVTKTLSCMMQFVPWNYVMNAFSDQIP